MKRSHGLRQLIGATLLASAVVALCNVHPRLAVAAPGAQRVSPAVPAVAPLIDRERALRDSIVSLARAQVGSRYVFGGTSPQGFDCSGLVRYVLAQVQLHLPRTARQQANTGAPIGPEVLKPGDLLTFGDERRVSHIGIYVGDGRFVHASSVAGKVIVSPVNRPPSRLIQPLRGARRLVVADSV